MSGTIPPPPVPNPRNTETLIGDTKIATLKIAALRLKFNAFKALDGEKVKETYTRLKILLNKLENKDVKIPQAKDNDSDVEEGTNSSSKFLADLNVEFHGKALLSNQKRFYKRSGRVGASRKPLDKLNETCFACGKLGHFQKDCPTNKTSSPSYPSSNKSYTKPKFHTNSSSSHQHNQYTDNG
ncbi:retrovirus-related pol polyprotein from transposon TNT 1-94 [Tanacetum coccineum]|uniref:Retrovirus-related pol polyprotein from transposon TNT 1-94 n=1 Tax=Tanacetum coccineum TaxID=301880 RepID=A0ABQ5FRY9_9ASTR